MNVNIWNYTGRSTPSWAVEIGDLLIYFSYRTPIAFHFPGHGLVVRENDWGPTTGRHLNEIDHGNKGERISGREFEEKLNSIVSQLK